MAALSIWGLAFCVLLVGGSVGTEEWSNGGGSPAMAVVGCVLWLIACWVALPDPVARRSMGLLHAVLVVVLVGAGYAGDFRFVWSSESLGMALLEAALAVTALVLLAPLPTDHVTRSERPRDGRRAGPGSSREGARFSLEARALLWTLVGVTCSMTGHNVGVELGSPGVGVAVGVVVGVGLFVVGRTVRAILARRGRTEAGSIGIAGGTSAVPAAEITAAVVTPEAKVPAQRMTAPPRQDAATPRG